MNNEKISKNDLINYLKEKPSYKDVENMIKDKLDERNFNLKFDEYLEKFEIFKKEINSKIEGCVMNKDLLDAQKNLEKKENEDIINIKNILEQKADKESVYSSLKLKSDKNEMNTILGNKLDKGDLAIIIKAINEKLNKEEFYKYREMNDNKGNCNNEYEINVVNDIKEINKDVQEMKNNMNKRIDIINCDIERLSDNIKNKFDYMNIAINNINKKTNETESNKNLINLIKKKLDTEKFDSFIKKIKNNLENNFLEIKK